MYRHLLVPIDGSPLSQHAIDSAIGLAQKLQARITAFVAEPPPPTPQPGYGAAGYLRRVEAHERETGDHASHLLQDFERRAKEAGVAFEGCTTHTGAIVETIVTVAEERHCDLIVMATHVHGWFAEVLGTSNTKGVMARTKVPLLVLH